MNPKYHVHTTPDASSTDSNSVRYWIQRPVVLIPIQADLRPALDEQRIGHSLEMSANRFSIAVEGTSKLAASRVVAGIEDKDFSCHFVVADIVSQEPAPLGWHLQLERTVGNCDVLSADAIWPKLNQKSYTFDMRIQPETLEEWCSAGVLQRRVAHRAYVCPDCSAVPICGSGCQNCGSAHVVPSALVHHFACAHVAFAHEFVRSDGIVCPKCHSGSLVVGADFENLAGPYRCMECGHSATELEQVGTCVPCGLRFPLSLAPQQEILGYHANRLDIQRLADQA